MVSGTTCEANARDLRGASPVVSVAFENDLFVLHLADELERTGADGMQAFVAAGAALNDAEEAVAEVEEQAVIRARFVCTVTVSGPVATTEVMSPRLPPLAVMSVPSIMLLMDQATSSAVSGLPSWKRTPLRMWKTHVSGSGRSQLVASHGCRTKCASFLTSAS